MRELAGTLAGKPVELPADLMEELPEGVEVEFAEIDPARIEFDEGAATLYLNIAELSGPRKAWYDFTVVVRFQPSTDGVQITFAREGHIELIGDGLSGFQQIGLRTIFTKVFATSRAIPLLPAHIAADARLANLQVTQCLAQNGWLGVALGPKRLTARGAAGTVR